MGLRLDRRGVRVTLPQFTTSKICAAGGICSICRQRETGRSLRASFAAAYAMPADAPDFECPQGRPWLGEQLRGVGDVVAAIADATGLTALAKCVERLTGKPCKCQGRRAKLNSLLPLR